MRWFSIDGLLHLIQKMNFGTVSISFLSRLLLRLHLLVRVDHEYRSFMKLKKVEGGRNFIFADRLLKEATIH